MRGRPNRVAGVHESIYSHSLEVRSLPFRCRCLSSLVFAKCFFLLPTLPPYGKYGGYVRFHWLAV